MLFKDNAKKKALIAAKKAYNEAAALKGDTREEMAFRRRIGFRSRTHLDKVFVEGATKIGRYQEVCVHAEASGQERPAFPKPSMFQTAKGPQGVMYTFVPLEFSEEVFKLGGQYQTMEIDAFRAIELTQDVANRVSFDLDLEKPIVSLQFLRDELAAAAGDANSAEESADEGSGEE